MRAIRIATRGYSSVSASTGASTAAPSVDTSVKRSVLGNGLEVFTVDKHSALSAVSAVFRGGSRYEDAVTAGSANTLSRLLYFANSSGKTCVAVTRDLLTSTADAFAYSGRETLTYGAEFAREQTDNVVAQLGAATQPLIREWEVNDVQELVEDDAVHSEESELVEQAHWVAFRSQGLGRAAHPVNGATATEGGCRVFADRYLTAANGVLVGVGVEHSSFVAVAEKAFGGLAKGKRAEAEKTRYVGGESHFEGVDHPHLVLGFQSGAWGSRDHFASGVVEQILGRTPDRFLNKPRPGDSLSSRFARRFTSEAGVISIDTQGFHYSDAGLFTVVVQAIGGEEKAVAQGIAAELGALASKPLGEQDLLGAKLRLKHYFLEGSECLSDRASFYAAQALCTGKVVCRNEFVSQIDSLTAADVQAAVKRMLSSPLTLVTEGRSSNVSIADIQSKF